MSLKNGNLPPEVVHLLEKIEQQEVLTESVLKTVKASTEEYEKSLVAQRRAFDKLTKPNWFVVALQSTGVLAIIALVVWLARQPRPEHIEAVNQRLDTVKEIVIDIDKRQTVSSKEIEFIKDKMIDIEKKLP